jgi:hypothetical protein
MHALLHDNPSLDRSNMMNTKSIGEMGLLRKDSKKKLDADGEELESSGDMASVGGPPKTKGTEREKKAQFADIKVCMIQTNKISADTSTA